MIKKLKYLCFLSLCLAGTSSYVKSTDLMEECDKLKGTAEVKVHERHSKTHLSIGNVLKAFEGIADVEAYTSAFDTCIVALTHKTNLKINEEGGFDISSPIPIQPDENNPVYLNVISSTTTNRQSSSQLTDNPNVAFSGIASDGRELPGYGVPVILKTSSQITQHKSKDKKQLYDFFISENSSIIQITWPYWDDKEYTPKEKVKMIKEKIEELFDKGIRSSNQDINLQDWRDQKEAALEIMMNTRKTNLLFMNNYPYDLSDDLKSFDKKIKIFQ